ncbi:Ig-like domain-containing protein [Pseudoalteromonas sp. MMG013]|uniref:Ig-like domain-containing protein n=1 Tax=Pseudoalteromonas sp. MMG013 TaxID=2822687 RepID=UPI001B359342|nr:Ig-like domain-containing protein [Pseudoalteromonas sp. MMG013]MBQ4862768.1 Ig-like domain-containing protein [Pseudoalteromonas sp. MMG013]
MAQLTYPIFCIIISVLLISCGEASNSPAGDSNDSSSVVKVTGVALSTNNVTLAVGETVAFPVTITPITATNKNIRWLSNNVSVANIASTGLITAIAEGSAVITVTTDDGSFSATTTITVFAATVSVSGIALSLADAILNVNNTLSLRAFVVPSNASDQNVFWSSSNIAVANVNSLGLVTAHSEGSAIISVTTNDGAFTAQSNIIVPKVTIPVTGVSLNTNDATLAINDTFSMQATISPSNASNKSVTWSTSDPSVASISNDGLVTANKAGSAILTVTTNDGEFVAHASLAVIEQITPVTGAALSTRDVTVAIGESVELIATVSPSTATNKHVSWSSSRSIIASVDNNGSVTANSVGSAVITVSTQDGAFTAKANIVVPASFVPVTGVSLTLSDTTLGINDTLTIGADISPNNASNKSVLWSSSNTAIASITASGTLVAHKEGSTTITVTTNDGEFTAQTHITVTTETIPVTGVTLSNNELNVSTGETTTLIATILPSAATNKNITWASSDQMIATVSNTGIVNGISSGKAIITVTTSNPSIAEQANITVTDPVSFSLGSSAMQNGGMLPNTYTCDGEGISPPLNWQGIPDNTIELALVMHHTAVQDDIQSHWVMYNIDTDINGVSANETQGSLGVNNINNLNAYAAPCSLETGLKSYKFTLYALSAAPELSNSSPVDRSTLLSAISNITLVSSELSVNYERDIQTDLTRCEMIQQSVVNSGFNSKVHVTCDTDHAYISSDTYPTHDLMNGITGTNEQIPVPATNYAAPIKLLPQRASKLTTMDAALGVAVNGVPIYDYSSAGELDVYNYDPSKDTVVTGQLDNCGGHAGRGDDYHYHTAPTCMMNSIVGITDQTIIGWAYDGYPLYGHNNPDGSVISSGTLDVCNGQNDESFGYRYHTSIQPPYIFQCLVGEINTNIIPRVAPLSGPNSAIRANLTPPQGGVENLTHTISNTGSRTMSYTYNGQQYYVTYTPSSTQAYCYDFEQKTVSNGGIVESGTLCRAPQNRHINQAELD